MIQRAVKTLFAIERAIDQDGGATFRSMQKEEVMKLTDAFDSKVSSGHRRHLGASLIGKPCARELWYNFRWVKRPEFSAQLLRLFNRGHLEEARFIALLRSAGMRVWSLGEDGRQLKISSVDGHFGGSLDAVVTNVPEDPEVPFLAEFKTHSNKSFTGLTSSGVKEAKWEHYVQMQIYMGGFNLRQALYLAVNKDNDALYAEVVPFDRETYDRYLYRAQAIVGSDGPPDRMHGASTTWYQCKYCTYYTMCHYFALPEKNCRTCAHSTPAKEGQWTCEKNAEIIDFVACEKYLWNPTILNGCEVVEVNHDENWMIVKTSDGELLDSREK